MKMKMKKFLKIIKSHMGCIVVPALNRMKSGTLRRRSRYARYYKWCKINKNVILYEAYFGRGMLCNPYAIFLQLKDDPKYSKFTHVWVLDNLDNHQILLDEYKGNNRVKFIQYQSRAYLKYLCKAKYLINNVTFPSFFTKREGQIYINTWHGIPLKFIGYDIPNGNAGVSNIIRNFIQTDYIISANNFLTLIYKKSYKLEGIYQGKIIEEGYPRLDILSYFTREQVLCKMKKYGLEIEETKKIILYAPTWRGETYAKADKDVERYFEFKEFLEQHINTNEYQVLIKVHQRVFQLSKDKLDIRYFIPAYIDANEALAITDILISDYSSIYFDFLATGKPLLFYVPDKGKFENERGMYEEVLKVLPGPETDDLEELCQWISDIEFIQKEYVDKYKVVRTWSNASMQNITNRIIDIVFNSNESNYNVQTIASNKIKLLFGRGELLTNGISSSLLNLLSHLDYNKFDVSVQIVKPKNIQQLNLANQIDSRARVLTRESTLNLTYLEEVLHRLISYYGLYSLGKLFYRKKIYQREFRRCYYKLDFDIVIDFEGFNFFFSLLHLQHENAKKAIWMHSNMQAEFEVRFPWLKKIFSLYPYYDFIISCGYEIMLVNKTNFRDIVAESKFRYVKNMITSERVLAGGRDSSIIEYDNREYCLLKKENDAQILEVDLIPFFPYRNNIISVDGSEYLINSQKLLSGGRVSLNLCQRSTQVTQLVRFVTMGRLSKEKNQLNLIKAFHKLHCEQANVMLYIIGEGPLRKEIEKLINALRLNNYVILTGNLVNPFGLMKYCDCFVLPSLHEGQPMVLHEARILKMPIIISDFSSVKGCLMENGQMLIGTSVDEIYEGLKGFLEGKVPSEYIFDPNEYNREAYYEFLEAIECDYLY